MVCGICKQPGHNRTTCTQRRDFGGAPTPPRKSGGTARGVGPAPRGGGFREMKSISTEEAQAKLAEVRGEQYAIANKCVQSLNRDKNCSIKAEEKTGKRMIMEAIHLIMLVNHGCKVLPEKSPPRSVYVTALNRRDTKEQFREQEDEFGILSIVATKHASLVAGIVEILNDDANDGLIYIHLDECDYGTGADQSLSKLYSAGELNLPAHIGRIKYVTYSATPEELEFSDTIRGWDQHVFEPSKDYIGARWYLDNDLVFHPETFFEGSSDFSHQGTKLIEEVRETCGDGQAEELRLRNVIVVRDTVKGNLGKIREMKAYLQDKCGCEIHIFDQNTSFAWGDPLSWASLGKTERLDDNMTNIGNDYIPVLIFISQICTRSTEICPLGHRKIAVWHDARKLEDKKAYNTISQAIGRVKHYSQEGHPVNRIKLYCDKDVLKKTVGDKIDTKVLVLSQRIATTSVKRIHAFKGYGDGFPEDVASVPDAEWQQEQEEKPACAHSQIDGRWCLYDQTKAFVRYWGESSTKEGRPPGYRCETGTHGQTTIEYESPSSLRFIIRTVNWEVSNVPEEDIVLEHKTKKSMW